MHTGTSSSSRRLMTAVFTEPLTMDAAPPPLRLVDDLCSLGRQTLADSATSRESASQPVAWSSARLSPSREQSGDIIVSLSTPNPLLCKRTHMTSSLRQPELFSINRFTVCWCFPKAVSSPTCVFVCSSEKMNWVEKTAEVSGSVFFICRFAHGVLSCFCLH